MVLTSNLEHILRHQKESVLLCQKESADVRNFQDDVINP